jgi:hypothetical protein
MAGQPTRPYSLRDFRSIFAVSDMQKQFGGEYEHATRRWRFATRDSAREARSYLSSRPEPHAIGIPGLEHHYQLVKANNGFLPSVRRFEPDPSGPTSALVAHKLFPGNVALFANASDAQNATLALYSPLQASSAERSDALTALRGAQPEWFSEPLDTIRARVQTICWQHEALEIVGRAKAGASLRAPSAGDAVASARAAETQANDLMRRLLHIENEHWREAPLPKEEFAGILIGRGPHHLAIITNEDGTGHLLPRELVQFPLRRDGRGERSPERGASIVVKPHETGAWTAFQDMSRSAPEWEHDLDAGPLLVQARVRANVLAPIVEVDPSSFEDYEGRIVSVGDAMVATLDAGATLAVWMKSAVPNVQMGARVQMGPSYSVSQGLQHAARR